ncbi:hypothetical protein B0T22DRAFT_152203 [Podospora appendiculata]|uniref:Uncharacterized protein n=1 Tax=Podospora appendiculata TaxID=314037 RepID=A0AAE0X9J3_9PEZI|nr:hypothetical protein B0T22DRAFT_152203 [Podospora appendiculata]
MVAGKQVLLSIAVLSGIGFNTALGAGWLRPRNGTSAVQVVASSSESAASSPSLSDVATPASVSVLTVEAAQPSADSLPAAASSAGKDSVSASIDPATTSTSSAILKLGVVTTATASPTSTEDDYIYPAVYGADGQLTTDTDAPTRTVAPSKHSISPNSGSPAGPPPMDDTAPSSSEVVIVSSSVVPVLSESAISADSSSWGYTAVIPVTSDPPRETAVPVRGPGGRPPPRPTITEVIPTSTDDFNLGHDSTASSTPASSSAGFDYGGWNSTTFATSTLYPNQTWTVTSQGPDNTVENGSSTSYCQASDRVTAITSWSVVHTSTITWYGNPEDYTQPFPPLTTPSAPTAPSCVEPLSPPKFTISVCSSTGTGSKYVTCSVTVSTDSWGYGHQTSSFVPSATPTVVLITTDKNPAVVYSTIKTPNYGVTTEPKTLDQHQSIPPDAPAASSSSSPYYNPVPVYNPDKSSAAPASSTAKNTQVPTYNSVQNSPAPVYDSVKSPVQPGQAISTPQQQLQHTTAKPVTVVVQPTAVVVNGNTITDNPSGASQVVVVSGETFTIGPTQIIGAGTTIDRPFVTGAVFPPTPTTTNLGGLQVVVSSSVAIIGGSSFTLGPTTTMAIVSGQTVTIGPSGVVVSSQTLSIPQARPSPTEVVVAGGDLITAIGQSVVVIQGTTITYGQSGSTSTTVVGGKTVTLGPSSTTVVGGETITLGPAGVTAHGTTLGGSSAKTSETQFAIIGGATITEIGASVVVINNSTYTVGPSAGTTTTIVGNETITIGPSGVAVSTMSFTFPFGPTMTVTITPGATMEAPTATPTAGAGAGAPKEDAAGGVLRPVKGLVSAGLCIAIGLVISGIH